VTTLRMVKRPLLAGLPYEAAVQPFGP